MQSKKVSRLAALRQRISSAISDLRRRASGDSSSLKGKFEAYKNKKRFRGGACGCNNDESVTGGKRKLRKSRKSRKSHKLARRSRHKKSRRH